MPVVGVQISDITDEVILEEAVVFIQSHLIMLRADIIRALNVPDFIFYSKEFGFIVLTGYSFTITPINITGPIYVNTSGGVIEIPIFQDSYKTLYQRLKADEHYPVSLIVSNDVKNMIDNFLLQNQLTVLETNGDFSQDFNNDYLT